MITIRFVSHPGIFDWATRIAQYGFWSTHCDTLMPNGTYLGARLKGGVLERNRDYDLGDFNKELFVNINCSEKQEETYYSFLRDQIGKPYDSLSIATFFSSRDWQAPDSWFCSELKAAGLAYCGVFPQHMAIRFNRLTPRDLMLLVSTLTEAG